LLKISSRDPGRTSLNSPLTSDPEEWGLKATGDHRGTEKEEIVHLS
jgi:hypothetical protein